TTAATAASCASAPTCAPSYCAPGCTSAPGYCAAACAASAPGCCTASSAPAATVAVCRKSYALAEPGIVFLVEDVERPQADVGNFLLIESDGWTQRGVLQRWYIRCRCVCCCAACHHQRHPGGSQCR